MAHPDTLLSCRGVRDPFYYPGQELKNDVMREEEDTGALGLL